MRSKASEIYEVVRRTAHCFRERAKKSETRITASAFDLRECGQCDASVGSQFLLRQASGYACSSKVPAEHCQNVGVGFSAGATRRTTRNSVEQSRRKLRTHSLRPSWLCRAPYMKEYVS